jgi:hypothetical protein
VLVPPVPEVPEPVELAPVVAAPVPPLAPAPLVVPRTLDEPQLAAAGSRTTTPTTPTNERAPFMLDLR